LNPKYKALPFVTGLCMAFSVLAYSLGYKDIEQQNPNRRIGNQTPQYFQSGCA